MLSKKKVQNLTEENKAYLEALEEFDRTGQLRKISVKERVNFTIDIDLMRSFRAYCEDHNQKMSSVVEQLIREEIGQEDL